MIITLWIGFWLILNWSYLHAENCWRLNTKTRSCPSDVTALSPMPTTPWKKASFSSSSTVSLISELAMEMTYDTYGSLNHIIKLHIHSLKSKYRYCNSTLIGDYAIVNWLIDAKFTTLNMMIKKDCG